MGFQFNDRYTLTAMVQAKNPDRTIELVKKGMVGGADAFGIQLETLNREYHTREDLGRIFAAGEGRPFYITKYRTGVNEGLSDDQLAEEILELADFDNVLIDVMADSFDACPLQITYDEQAVNKQKQLIEALHQKGAQVLMSTHTDRFIPPQQVLDIARAQVERGADIAKVVINANTAEEEASAFETSALLARELKHPFLFLCAGNSCFRHRRVAPLLSNGLILCVPERDEHATPVQILLSKAKAMLDILVD